MKTIVIDCGAGNLRSVVKALEHMGFKGVKISSDHKEIKDADYLIFPGQGAFKKAMENLEKLKLSEAIKEHIERGKPFLGICLGLQLLFEKSYEHGESKGLGIFKGEVVLLPKNVKLPHIGWNQIWKRKDSYLFKGIEDGDFFYFVHSYRAVPQEKEIISTETDYGEFFVSAIEKENVCAVQFHPEKSQKKGLKVLENFRKFF